MWSVYETKDSGENTYLIHAITRSFSFSSFPLLGYLLHSFPMSAEASSSSGLPSDEFNDVEDFLWDDEGEGISKRERFTELLDLFKNGNRAFRENRMEEAINCYTKANNILPSNPVILSNRCIAYIRISESLKQRNPTDSEYRPLNGLDPTVHAELALKDAVKLMNLQSNCNSVKSYFLKANALISLEKYDLAREVILSGLQVDPLSNALQVSLEKLEKAAASLTQRCRGKPECSDDFDCTLCLKLLFEPVTTACGHSFCRSCLFQAMDCSNKCPLCRTVLFINPRTCSISVTLNNIIQRNFPEEYAERKSEHESLTNFGIDLLPLFVMDVVLPCQKVLLNIFEPRYRLMVRRIMEGNHRMGMVILNSTTGFPAEFGCEVEITECDPLPDGRFYLEVEGRRRFRIINCWDQDGYRVASVEWVQDILPADKTKEQVDLQEMANNAANYAEFWIRRAKQAAWQDRRRLAELFHAEAMMPAAHNPELFSFWLASLSNRRPPERLDLLVIRDTKERIRRGLIYMRDAEQGCQVQ